MLASYVVIPFAPGVVGADLNIGLLYMSGYADDESVLESVASSGVRCLAKPFTMRGLLDAADEAMSQTSTRRSRVAQQVTARR